jgi:hypothetical protein
MAIYCRDHSIQGGLPRDSCGYNEDANVRAIL